MIKDFFKGFMEGLKLFGENIAAIINSLLLSFVYFVGIGFTYIISRIKGKAFLETKLSKKKSYWNTLNLKKKPMEKYYRTF